MRINLQHAHIAKPIIQSAMNDKILIIGPSWVGDMIMAQSLFKLLKQNNPLVLIDVLAPEWSLPILERMPEINNRFCLPVGHGKLGLLTRFKIAKKLRAEEYTQAIVLANTWKSALVPWLAKIPKRTGWLGECRWGLLNDIRYLDKKALPKMVQRYAALGLPKNQQLPANIPVPKLLAHPRTAPSSPVLALCPGAAYGPAKRWPTEYFAQLANAKLADGWQVWLFGSQQDVAVVEEIRQQLTKPSISYAGKIDLMQTIDLFSVVDAVVSNDSGLMHLAASLDKPVVAIYGSTSPEFTPPLGEKSRILQHKIECSPCFKRECPLGHFACMRNILPEQVILALAQLETERASIIA